MRLPDATEANTFNTDEYSDSSIMSDFFAAEAGKILARDSAVINNYIAVLNSRISNVKINDITLNSSDGWDKAIAYIDGTSIEEQVAAMKNSLLDGISKAELTEVLGLYSSLKTSDIALIEGKITNLDSKVLTYINDGEVSYTVTFEKGTAPVGNKAVAEFILDQFKSSTVKEFFETYGKVTFTAKYGEKTSVITIDSVEL
ncbi:hypothetical protein SDC9_167246 [bioreactor metagenome]|uniref:Uncharacterized protein n=1 Tax=bioreactor metagenome TaxID=1076179 RepID=A0A645FZ95_9ZZZZ